MHASLLFLALVDFDYFTQTKAVYAGVGYFVSAFGGGTKA
jgi:hypothetical protein